MISLSFNNKILAHILFHEKHIIDKYLPTYYNYINIFYSTVTKSKHHRMNFGQYFMLQTFLLHTWALFLQESYSFNLDRIEERNALQRETKNKMNEKRIRIIEELRE